MRSIRGTPMVYDVVEFSRALLYNNFAKKNKFFNKRTHIYQEDSDQVYIEEEETKVAVENLVKKDHYTACTRESFL